jgi:hypothetical protein
MVQESVGDFMAENGGKALVVFAKWENACIHEYLATGS